MLESYRIEQHAAVGVDVKRIGFESGISIGMRSMHAQDGIDQNEAARFAFGGNWKSFIKQVSDDRVAAAEESLKNLLGEDTLHGRNFLDVGAGSGLFSLAARRLGATVCSFDPDPECLECAEYLRQRFDENSENWTIQRGSILDREFISELGQYDVVYAWGVLHHTGNMWLAMEIVGGTVQSGGTLILAIYNDQGWRSQYWKLAKKLYNRSAVLKFALIVLYTPYFVGLRYLIRKIKRKGKLERGMSLWHDMLDWLGGYPFEVAKPLEIKAAMERKGFVLVKERTCGSRSGCNEFLFTRS